LLFCTAFLSGTHISTQKRSVQLVPSRAALREADAITLSPMDVANDTSAVEVAVQQLMWIDSGERQQYMIFFGSQGQFVWRMQIFLRRLAFFTLFGVVNHATNFVAVAHAISSLFFLNPIFFWVAEHHPIFFGIMQARVFRPTV